MLPLSLKRNENKIIKTTVHNLSESKSSYTCTTVRGNVLRTSVTRTAKAKKDSQYFYCIRMAKPSRKVLDWGGLATWWCETLKLYVRCHFQKNFTTKNCKRAFTAVKTTLGYWTASGMFDINPLKFKV